MFKELKLSIIPVLLSPVLYAYDYVQIQVQDLMDLASYNTVLQKFIPLTQEGEEQYVVNLKNGYTLNLQFTAKNIFANKNAYLMKGYIVKNGETIAKDVDFSTILDNDNSGVTETFARGRAPRLSDAFFRHYYRLCLRSPNDYSPCEQD